MARVMASIASIFLAIYLFGYEPSKTEALVVFGFGLFMGIAGALIKEEE